jgi:hypothetical protein
MSVKRCQQEVDAAEFVEWMLYCELEPFGAEQAHYRADLRAGIIASTIANVNSTKRRFTPKDFMPTFGARTAAKPAQPLDQQRAVFELFVAAQNASIGLVPHGAPKG